MNIYTNFGGEGDPRFNHRFYLRSPIPILTVIFFYLGAIRIGPKLMENRKPFELKAILRVYNIVLVSLSLYMCIEATITSYLSNYNFWCDLVDYSIDPLAIRTANLTWWFLLTKVMELFETIFFILRKKSSQISFLHVYHHCIMLCITWIGVKYFPGGEGIILVLLNTFVHTVMYSYYALSTFGESLKPYLWWKRYLTQLQLAQFIYGTTHVIYGIYHNCQYPRFIYYASATYIATLAVLFGNFYIKTYINGITNKPQLSRAVKMD